MYKSIDEQANKVRQGHLIISTSVFTFASWLVMNYMR